MAAQTVFSVEMFPVSVPLMEDAQSDMPRNTLPAPQLVMLANVAAVTAAESSGGDGSAVDEKEMMELKTVGCSYSDSEEENIVSYDNQNYREVCILEYPESPSPNIVAVVVGNDVEEEGVKAEDLSHHTKPRPSACTKTPEQVVERPRVPVAVMETTKKKKPFQCKPCHFQAQNEQEFVKHLGTHGVSKMMVVNRVEGRSKTRTKDAPENQEPSGGEAESGEEAAAGDVKGLIRCERCGYNTNRYDHYIAHLKHHSKEGEDHRVFKCTLCPYTTVSQYHWRKHLRNHFPSKLHTCSQCSYFSDRKSNYIQHIRTHTGVRPFQCPYCDYSSSQKTHLTRHMRTHSGERPFKCESCNYLAANQHEVTRHARQVHNGPKPLSCPYCEYKTADRSNFKKHVELHLNPRQFLCPLCKYAASKKCNLQYHIKSRHSGCDVSVDISKVKLRVKKPGADSAEENQDSGAGKFDNSSGVEEDFDMEDEGEGEDSSPINLSIKKSSQPSIAQPVQTEAPDKPPKKSSVTAEKEKLQKVKEKVEPEKKITTRQKKTEKVNENPLETETITAAVNTDKVKRRVKKTTVQVQTETDKPDQQRPEEEREVRQKEEEKVRPEKGRGHQKNDGTGKENKSLNKPRKSGSKKSQKIPEHVVEAQQKPGGPEKKEKVVKEKAAKRKAAEALDLSKRSSSETPSKARRLKAGAAEKLQVKPASEDTKNINDAAPPPQRSTGSDRTGSSPVKQKKIRNTSKKATSLQQAVDPVKDQKTSVHSPEASAELDHPKKTSTDETTPTLPEKTLNKPTCSSGEDTPSPAEDRPAPTFVKPTSPPSLVLPGQRNKTSDPEDDEGIHSSHEGGSDISDSASENSDDSGLNSNDAGSGKMANDPETPTDEIPSPTELKSHLCIFCDRTFPLEAEYRRHLNRHLVNVYYLDDTAKVQE
ncbi:RE1-silencing transcription factor isoform X2 [Anarrhichthys ocellatus]|uniref:RE1-silencing transcription factor isoform X2 n=1 Tax=Anarrhichthys ocellatus TaxID=433405 RepID=UPI0012EED15A|nr:RE1-silencing transcription factor B-like isoform X2 [Anarrhichthys ocellatus]